MTAARGLAGFVTSISPSVVPREARAATKRHLLDSVGVALAAAGTAAATPIVDAVRAWGGTREAPLIGVPAYVPAPSAALANGALIHALDFDDTHVESLVHPSSVVVPAALAVGMEAGSNGRDVVTACVIGYEIAARIGAAAMGRLHIRGFHPTGLIGTFSAAAVAARLWGLSEEETTHALGISGSQSSGLFAALADGSETNRFHPGWASHAGVIAADLARRGFSGPEHVLEGPNGFFGAFLAGETPALGRVLRGLGYEWETLRIAIKPYPADHFVHAHMDAVSRMGVRAGDVQEILCRVPGAAVGIVCEPRAAKIAPATAYIARFSLPFAVAVAIVGGREGLELFDEDARTDKRVLALAERVTYEIDETLPFPATYGGRLTVRFRDGREREVEELVNRGHPDRPLSDDEVREKFFRNARYRLDEASAEKLADAIGRLDELDSLADVAELLQGA